MLDDYHKTLKDLDKVNVLKINNAFTLKTHGKVKRMLNDYHETLQDLNKVDVLKLENAFILKRRRDVKKCWMTIMEP
jgi:hypothetical protein